MSQSDLKPNDDRPLLHHWGVYGVAGNAVDSVSVFTTETEPEAREKAAQLTARSVLGGAYLHRALSEPIRPDHQEPDGKVVSSFTFHAGLWPGEGCGQCDFTKAA